MAEQCFSLSSALVLQLLWGNRSPGCESHTSPGLGTELELLEPHGKMDQVRITSSGKKGLVLLYLEQNIETLQRRFGVLESLPGLVFPIFFLGWMMWLLCCLSSGMSFVCP